MMRTLVLALLLGSATASAAPRTLVPAKSEVAFSVKQMGVAVDGHFGSFTARIDLDPAKPAASSAEVTVDIASLSTGDADADSTARDQPWLDAATYRSASFKSSAVRLAAPDRYEVTGTLTLRGQSRPLNVTVTTQTQADGVTVASGAFTLLRTDFGIGGGEWNQGDVVAKDVAVHFRFSLAPAK
jgi:polyisoprenoid-binding protein YceI